jgi:hypothetical protein
VKTISYMGDRERNWDRNWKELLTSYCRNMLGLLPSGKENDIALRGIQIAVFKKEYPVDSIFLEGGELDEQAQWSSKRALNDKIFLPSNLRLRLVKTWS